MKGSERASNDTRSSRYDWHKPIPGGQRNPVTKRALCVICLRDVTIKYLPDTYMHIGLR